MLHLVIFLFSVSILTDHYISIIIIISDFYYAFFLNLVNYERLWLPWQGFHIADDVIDAEVFVWYIYFSMIDIWFF